METLTRCASVTYRSHKWRQASQTVALVPTEGTLHKGHMSLVAAAQDVAQHVIVSIVAPPLTQAPSARTESSFEADRELLLKVGAEVLFVPPVQEIFPVGRDRGALIRLPGLSEEMEGEHAGFAESLTVLLKLCHIASPDFIVQSEQRYQQLITLRRLMDDLFLPIEILARPTWRDPDGLATGAGNRALTAEERAIAPGLYATVKQLARSIDAGERDLVGLERQGAHLLNEAGFVSEYLKIRQAADLSPVGPETRDLVILAAARVGRHRLVDNQRVRLIDRY